jgi:hypothetical protein
LPTPPVIREITGFVGQSARVMGQGPRTVALRSQAQAWLKKSGVARNGAVPQKFVDDMMVRANASLDVELELSLALGSGLMQSGKATQMAVVDGAFFALPMTDAEVARRKMGPTTISNTQHRDVMVRVTPEAAIESLVLDGGGKWDGSKALTGKVRTKSVRASTAPGSATYKLRMVSLVDGKRRIQYAPVKLAGEQAVRFEMPEEDLAAIKTGVGVGPRIFVFSIVRSTPTGAGLVEELISEAVTKEIEVLAK